MRRRPALAAALALAALLVGCRGEGDGSRSVELTAKDDGRTVTAQPADVLILRLDSNPTTGYEWSLTRKPDAAVLESLGHKYEPPETGLVGAGGVDVWRFRAIEDGNTSFELKYGRPFGNDPPAGSFSLTVDVSAA